MIYRILLIVSLTIGTYYAIAQGTQEKENALQKVIEILTSKKPFVNSTFQLTSGAWEALSYIEEGKIEYNKDDLLEAVPDYYSFEKNSATIKFVNPNNVEEYGTKFTVNYRVEGAKIILLDNENKERDSWTILYLDNNYLALDMGELRVFFTKTAKKE